VFYTLSFLFYARYQSEKKWPLLVLSSFFLGLGFILLQKSIFLIFAMGVVILFDVCRRRVSWASAFAYLACLIITIAPYLLYFWAKGLWEEYLICSWLANLKFVDASSASRVTPFYSFKRNMLLWVFFVLGCFVKKDNANQHKTVIFSCILLVLILLSMPMQQYFLPDQQRIDNPATDRQYPAGNYQGLGAAPDQRLGAEGGREKDNH